MLSQKSFSLPDEDGDRFDHQRIKFHPIDAGLDPRVEEFFHNFVAALSLS